VAQTWRVTRGKRLIAAAVDGAGIIARPLIKAKWPPMPRTDATVERILVMEPWLIGDVVLATPILRALRNRYPSAEIALLGKRHAADLLDRSGLVDRVIVFDLPWTANEGKYRPTRYDRSLLSELFRDLREARFSLTLDARMDVRSNIVTYSTGAPRRIGYDFGGGAFLLTDALPARPSDNHRVHDWLALMKPLDDGRWGKNMTAKILGKRFTPQLAVTSSERQSARLRLRALGFGDDDRIVGIHPGASRPRGRWPLENFAFVTDSLCSRHGVRCLVFVDPEGYGEAIPVRGAAQLVRASLREMMALMTHCDLFVCNDSGPMHVADALRAPVVGIFTTGNPVWHRPFSDGQVFVGRGTGHESIHYPSRDEVLAAAERRLLSTQSLQATGEPLVAAGAL
jgi:heptosyltransferase II